MIKRLLLSFLAGWMIFGAAPSWATTYYIKTSGSNSNDGLTTGAPKLNFAGASGVSSVYAAGDTVIFLSTGTDGNGRTVYSGAENQINTPLSGSSGANTTFQGEAGKWIYLDGGGARTMITIEGSTRAYISFLNLGSINPGEAAALNITSPDSTALVNQTHDILVSSCALRGGAIDNNVGVINFSQIRDSTISYTHAWGAGRNTYLEYGCTNMHGNKNVFRWDYWEGDAYIPTDPRYPHGTYNSKNSTHRNFALIDQSTNNAGLGERSALYIIGNTAGVSLYTHSDLNHFYGGIIYNNANSAAIHNEGANSLPGNSTNTISGIAAYKNAYGIDINKNAQNTILTHITASSNTTAGSYLAGGGDNVTGTVIKNSEISGNVGNGLDGSGTFTYNNVHGNGTNYAGAASAGTGSISSAPAHAYIYRIEAGAPGATRGDDGSNMGADVQYEFDENGATTTAKQLPWPGDARIVADFCDGTYQSGAGLCGMATPDLDNYLHRAIFGNEDPDAGVDVTSPTAPTNLSTTSVSASSLGTSWTASSDAVGVAGYYIDVSTHSNFSEFIGSFNNLSIGTGTTYSITGLSASTTYYFRVRARDAQGNTSTDSSTQQGITSAAVAASTAGSISFGSGTIRLGSGTINLPH